MLFLTRTWLPTANSIENVTSYKTLNESFSTMVVLNSVAVLIVQLFQPMPELLYQDCSKHCEEFSLRINVLNRNCVCAAYSTNILLFLLMLNPLPKTAVAKHSIWTLMTIFLSVELYLGIWVCSRQQYQQSKQRAAKNQQNMQPTLRLWLNP